MESTLNNRKALDLNERVLSFSLSTKGFVLEKRKRPMNNNKDLIFIGKIK